MNPLRFAGLEAPEVTIAIVLYGRWDLARRALAALRAHTEDPYEVVVVDNASPDGAADRLEAETEGVRLLRNARNEGFGVGANRAAGAGRGRLLCLLNSDAFVTPGWLGPLRSRLDADRTIGAVVPMFLDDDGRVQEAGSVVGCDGVTLAIGRGEDSEAPGLAGVRDVDYGSAACMLVRRQEFLEVEGFDPAYGLGYYEDVDLCFRLAARGSRTVVEPTSRVVHGGEGSAGHEIAAERMRNNRAVFLDRWGSAVASRPALARRDAFPHRAALAREARASVRVLVLPGSVPASATAARVREMLPGAAVAVAPSHPVPSWFVERRNLFDLVVAAGDPGPDLDRALGETQPGAVVLPAEELALALPPTGLAPARP